MKSDVTVRRGNGAPPKQRSMVHIVLLPVPAVMAALVLFAPIDVLDRWVWAGVFVEHAREWMPFIPDRIPFSRFPQVIMLSASLMVPAMVVQLLVYAPVFVTTYTEILRRGGERFRDWKRLGAACVVTIVIVGWYCANRDAALWSRFRMTSISDPSRLLIAFVDFGSLLLGPMACCVLVVVIHGAVRRRRLGGTR